MADECSMKLHYCAWKPPVFTYMYVDLWFSVNSHFYSSSDEEKPPPSWMVSKLKKREENFQKVNQPTKKKKKKIRNWIF